MRYRNKITGIEITTLCAISSPDYEAIDGTAEPKADPKAEPKPEPVKKVAKPVKRVKK